MTAQAAHERGAPAAANGLWAWLTAAAGIAFVVLTVGGFILAGEDPTPAASLEEVRAYFVEYRSQVLTAV